MLKNDNDNQHFDFDVGYLVKSPCKDCKTRSKFPACIDDCNILDQIQSALSESMSCANSLPAAEPFSVPLNVLEQI